MPRRKFIDKKNATTFALLHRAQADPLINDEDAPSMVFAEKSQPRRPTEDDYAYSSAASILSDRSSGFRSSKTKQRGDLEEEFGFNVRANEGEAAQHGVYFDDTEYDYMQHMRDIGSGEGAVTWVEASAPAPKEKRKQRLEDALIEHDDLQSVGTQDSRARSLLPEEVLPSEFVRRTTYQDQQDIPDELAGFQPDLDPRLREVLEALEDEAYVDDADDDDLFGSLTKDGFEVERDEWERLGEQQMFEEGEGELPLNGDDDGWESDDTITAMPPSQLLPALQVSDREQAKPPEDALAQPPADPTEGAWLDEFQKFKIASKSTKPSENPIQPALLAVAPATLQSSALSSLASGRHKKRKGAKTSTTNYSMTSSALARTDQQTLLDSRFDKIEEEYSVAELPNEEDDELNDAGSLASGMTGVSRSSRISKYSAASGMSRMSGISSYSRATDSEAPQLQRMDFDSIMDDFLGSHAKSGRRVRRGGPPQTGMEQLDEIRSGLGPARLKTKTASRAL